MNVHNTLKYFTKKRSAEECGCNLQDRRIFQPLDQGSSDPSAELTKALACEVYMLLSMIKVRFFKSNLFLRAPEHGEQHSFKDSNDDTSHDVEDVMTTKENSAHRHSQGPGEERKP